MSLQSRLGSLISEIGLDIKALEDSVDGVFKPETHKGAYNPAAAYASGDSVAFEGRVYTANTALAADTHTQLPTYVGSWVVDRANTSGTTLITLPANAVALGDLLVFVSNSNNDTLATDMRTQGWTVLATNPAFSGGTTILCTKVATATEVAGTTVGGGTSWLRTTGMLRAYRGGMLSNQSIWADIVYPNTNPSGNTPERSNSAGTTNPHIEVGFYLTFSTSAYTVTADVGVSNIADTSGTVEYAHIKAWDKLRSGDSDWSLSQASASANISDASLWQFNLLGVPDPAKWTFSQGLTELLIDPNNLLAQKVHTAGTYSTSATLASLDTVNLVLTFVAKTSKVNVTLEAYANGTSSSGDHEWGLKNASDAQAEGTSSASYRITPSSNNTAAARYACTIPLTGLALGTTYTVRWAGKYATITGSVSNPLIMQAWSVPE